MTEKPFSSKEIADELGVTEAEFIQMAIEHGLLDANGMPTEYAINEGIVCLEHVDPGFGLN